jgi:nucleotide-binding universal stress UspA family protein
VLKELTFRTMEFLTVKETNMKTTRKIKTILCPIYFDVNSLAALDMARNLARENGATLYVLHVVIPPHPLLISAPFLSDREHHYAGIRLDEIARESLRDVDHRVVLRSGDPAEQIIKTAVDVEADLVIMATHGRTGVPRFSWAAWRKRSCVSLPARC